MSAVRTRTKPLSRYGRLRQVKGADRAPGFGIWARLSDDWDLLNQMTGGFHVRSTCPRFTPAVSGRYADQGSAAEDADDVSASDAGVHPVSGPFARYRDPGGAARVSARHEGARHRRADLQQPANGSELLLCNDVSTTRDEAAYALPEGGQEDPRGAERRGGYAHSRSRAGARAQIPGGLQRGIWRRAAGERGHPPESRRYRQRPDADPH